VRGEDCRPLAGDAPTEGAQRVDGAGRCGRRRSRSSRAGLPTTTAWSGTSRVTTAPAPIIAWLPTRSPSTSVAPAPIQTSSPSRRMPWRKIGRSTSSATCSKPTMLACDAMRTALPSRTRPRSTACESKVQKLPP
jgi:hypothetical protein